MDIDADNLFGMSQSAFVMWLKYNKYKGYLSNLWQLIFHEVVKFCFIFSK